MTKKIAFCVSIFITITLNAQINEIGLFVGGSNYIGDVGSTDYINPKDLTLAVIYKWNMSPQAAIRYSFTYANFSANNAQASTNVLKNNPFNFKNTYNEFAVGIEFNFFKYNLNQFRFRHTPYVFLNIAAFSYKIPPNSIAANFKDFTKSTSISFPFGVGYKVRLAQHLGMTVETRFNYTNKDNLEGDQLPIANFNNPNNKDWVVITGFSLVYAFGERTCYFDNF